MLSTNEQHAGLDMLELCHKTRGWFYVIGRGDDHFYVTLLGKYSATRASLHEAAAAAVRLALEEIGEK